MNKNLRPKGKSPPSRKGRKKPDRFMKALRKFQTDLKLRAESTVDRVFRASIDKPVKAILVLEILRCWDRLSASKKRRLNVGDEPLLLKFYDVKPIEHHQLTPSEYMRAWERIFVRMLKVERARFSRPGQEKIYITPLIQEFIKEHRSAIAVSTERTSTPDYSNSCWSEDGKHIVWAAPKTKFRKDYPLALKALAVRVDKLLKQSRIWSHAMRTKELLETLRLFPPGATPAQGTFRVLLKKWRTYLKDAEEHMDGIRQR